MEPAIKTHFRVMQFINESAVKLELKSETLATTSYIYHKFFDEFSLKDFDPYMIATSALYLAGKVEEEHPRVRDVINVAYRCLHKDRPPLDIGDTYFALRDSLTDCELFLLRGLNFQVSFEHPHKYLLHYLKSVLNWLHPTVAQDIALASFCWALLRDSYYSTLCLRCPAQHLAVSILYMALQCFGVQVPYDDEADYKWWQVLVADIHIDEIRYIIKEIIKVYEMEEQLDSR